MSIRSSAVFQQEGFQVADKDTTTRVDHKESFNDTVNQQNGLWMAVNL